MTQSDAPPESAVPRGGEGEAAVLAIRGSTRRLLRRTLQARLETAERAEARRALEAYAADAKTSPSERRKALTSLVQDDARTLQIAAATTTPAPPAPPPPALPAGGTTQVQVNVLTADAADAAARLLAVLSGQPPGGVRGADVGQPGGAPR